MEFVSNMIRSISHCHLIKIQLQNSASSPSIIADQNFGLNSYHDLHKSRSFNEDFVVEAPLCVLHYYMPMSN